MPGLPTPSVTGLRQRLFAAILGLTAAAGLTQAGDIYKSVDAGGNVVYSDHLDPSMQQSTVVQLEDPRFPPRELHFCWTNCFTLVLDHGVYRRVDGTEETWSVETFSDKSVVLHRHDEPADWNGHSGDVVYAGRVANDRLVGVTVNGAAIAGIDASWGDALNTLPGSNAERDAGGAAIRGGAAIGGGAAIPDGAEIPDASPNGTLSTTMEPPPVPAEEQPDLPQDGYLWTPGYWHWRSSAYVWIPGAWMRPPHVGALWTPGYWSRAGTVFIFHPGYWAATVGYYGAVNYGCGYFGNGYTGGHWIGHSFAYNSAVNHVNPAIAHHTYAQPVPDQASRNALAHNVAPRVDAVGHTPSLHQSPPAPVNPSTEPDRPATLAKKSAPRAPTKPDHHDSPRAAPIKQ